MRPKHLQAYLDEFVFRQNRRKTKGVGRIAARVREPRRPPAATDESHRQGDRAMALVGLNSARGSLN